MPAEPFHFLAPLGFLAFFAAMWLGIGGLLAYLSGWITFARTFRTTIDGNGERFRFASGAIGASKWFPVNYRNCLTLDVGREGLRLAMFFPFRFLCPPLFIPWQAVESVAEERFWMVKYSVIRVRGFSARILVRGQAGEKVRSAYAAARSGTQSPGKGDANR